MASQEDIAAQKAMFSILTAEMRKYDSSLASLTEHSAKFKAEMHKLGEEMRVGNVTLKGLITNSSGYAKSLQDQIRAMRQNEIEAKRLALAYGVIAFKVGDASTKLEMSAKAAEKISKSFSNLSNVVGKNTLFSFEAIVEELKKFNRSSFEVSRQLQVMGQAMNEKKMTAFANSINLSRTQTMDLVKAFNEVGNAAENNIEKLRGLAKLAASRFGGSAEVIRETTLRFAELDNMMPGLNEELSRFSDTGKSSVRNIGSMLMTMRGLGANTRSLQTLAQAYTDITRKQKSMLEYETAAQSRNKAIADANLAVGKSSEVMLAGIEANMAKMVQVGEKIATAFKPIPMVLMTMKAIGISSVAGVLMGVKGLITAVQMLRSNVSQTSSEFNNMGNSARRGFGAGKMLLGGAGALGVGMTAYGAYQSMVEGGAAGSTGKGTSLGDAAAAGVAGRSAAAGGMGNMIGMLAGGALGFAFGGGVGAVPGAMLGGMAGEKIGSLFGGSEKEGAAAVRMAKSLDNLGGLEVKSGTRLQSKGDVYRLIKSQKDEMVKINAIQRLIDEGGEDEADIRRELGDELVRKYREQEKIAKQDKEALTSAMLLNENYQKMAGQLKNMSDNYSKILSSINDLKGATSDNTLMTAEATHYAQEEAKAKRESAKIAEGELKLLKDFETAALADSTRESLKERISLLGIQEDQQKNVLSIVKDLAEQSRIAMSVDASPEAKSAARNKTAELSRQYDQLSAQLGIREKMDKVGLGGDASDVIKNVGAMDDLAKATRMQAAESKAIVANLEAAKSEAIAVTASYKAQDNLLANIQELEQTRADYLGKTAAGYAMHFQGEKRVYDTIVKRVDFIKRSNAELGAQMARSAKGVLGAGIQGVSNELLTAASGGDVGSLERLNAIKQKLLAIPNRDDAANNQLRLLSEFLTYKNKEIENEKELLKLRSQQVEKALALKEGYLDVINEMTTGSDMISQLVADSSRGIMSLQQASMIGAGEDIGGATRRGFVSIDPFKSSMSMAGAARYTSQGFVGPGSQEGTILGAHINRLIRGGSTEAAAGGPGSFSGPDLGRSALFESGTVPEINTENTAIDAKNVTINGPIKGPGKASGGLIPGSPSSSDNRMGMLDGKYPIGLASGEFVVNANATKNNLALLQAINGGFAVGGIAQDRGLSSFLSGMAVAGWRGAKRIGGHAAGVAISPIMGWGGGTLRRDISDSTGSVAHAGAGGESAGPSSGEAARNKKYAAILQIQSMLDQKLGGIGVMSNASDYFIDKGKLAEARQKLGKLGISDENMVRRLAMANSMTARQKNMATRQTRDSAHFRDIERAFSMERIAMHKTGSAWSEGSNAGLLASGLATGGLASTVANAMSLSGGMRIGTLMLNGKVIGQDVRGGLGSEWQIAAQNAYG